MKDLKQEKPNNQDINVTIVVQNLYNAERASSNRVESKEIPVKHGCASCVMWKRRKM
jgi:hypothetical protein